MSRRRWLARITLSVGLLLALLALGELLLWATGLVRDPQEFQFRRVARAVAEDPEGRYAIHPERFYTVAPQHRHAPGHLGRDATGSWPYRGRPAEPAPPGLLRVVLVGDSCVYGASLDVASSLGAQVQEALAARGLTADRVAVLSLGVPGYSTVQLQLLLDEALETLHPDLVVLHPAAWNDQAPALRCPDRELLAELEDPSLLDWLRTRTRVGAAVMHKLDSVPQQEILDGWNAGRPPRGFRVPADEVGPNVSAMLARCAAAGVPCVLLSAPHPQATLDEHPRTAQDAQAALDAARAAGVPAIDGQALLVATHRDLSRYFLDYVHPSPEGTAVLAPPVADAVLAQLLRPAVPPGSPAGAPMPLSPAAVALAGDPAGGLSIASVQPATASVFGDQTLSVTLGGWTSAEPLPAVIVGGAPLLDLRAVAPDTVEGVLMTNAAGLEDVIVQSARGCALKPGAVARLDPQMRLVVEPDGAHTLTITGRPGDRYQVFVGGTLRETPEWTLRGAYWLDPATSRPVPPALVAGEDGVARLPLPPRTTGRAFVQALAVPRSEPEGATAIARWTPVAEFELGP